MQNLDEANRMLDTFASVGARYFDVTFLDIDGGKRGFRKGQSVMQLRNSLPKLLPGLTERRNSLVVRPQSDDVTLVQLDDLDSAALERVRSIAFLTLTTSPGNHQAWVAIDHIADAGKMMDIARHLRKGTGADLSASGATRIAGAVNYKAKYAPNFPTVAIVDAHPGRIVTPEQLEQLGLLAAPEPAKILRSPPRVSARAPSDKWPSYAIELSRAPLKRDGKPDRSTADINWCMVAVSWRHSVEDVAARLLDVSEKAYENVYRKKDDKYPLLTARKAARYVEENRQRGLQRG